MNNIRFPYWMVIWWLCLPALSYTQIVISYTNPSANELFQVCGEAPFEVSINNQSADTLRTLEGDVLFPVGIAYVSGSVVNATELDISIPNQPFFSLPDLAPNTAHNFTLTAAAQCPLVEEINEGALFSNTINLQYEGGNSSIITTDYEIETPLLVITNVTNITQSGIVGDVLFRTVTIENTRLGTLSSFTFRDQHQGGMHISTDIGSLQVDNPTLLEVSFSSADFSSIGDGDLLFERGEQITLTEIIEITDCGNPSITNISQLEAEWGCNGAVCQVSSPVNAGVQYLIADISPELVFCPLVKLPDCFCGPEGTTQGMLIKNQGTVDGESISFSIAQRVPVGGIAANSIRIDSNGIINSLEPLNGISYLPSNACMLPNGTYYSTVFLTIPAIAAGDSLTLLWDVMGCGLEACDNHIIEWHYGYTYSKPCPVNSFVEAEDIMVSDTLEPQGIITQTGTSGPIGTQTYHMNYQLITELLTDFEGELTLDISFPCIFDWANSPLSLGGHLPLSTELDTLTSAYRIRARYDLPLSADDLSLDFDLIGACAGDCFGLFCDYKILNSCIDTLSEGCNNFDLQINASFDADGNCPENCEIAACSSFPLLPPCDFDDCPVQVPGYLNFEFQAARINFGWADDNDDRIADSNNPPNLNLAQTSRAIKGDTICTELQGDVVIDVAGSTFENGEIVIRLNPYIYDGALNTDMFHRNAFIHLNSILTIYDRSSGNYYECSDIPSRVRLGQIGDEPVLSHVFNIQPRYLADTLGCSIPPELEYAEEDSIFFRACFVVNENIMTPDITNPQPTVAGIQLSADVYLYTEVLSVCEMPYFFSCPAPGVDFLICGYEYEFFPGAFPVPICEASPYTSSSFFRMELGEPNFFPFEFRSLIALNDWQLDLPPEFRMDAARISVLQLQGPVDIFTNEDLSPNFSGGLWDLGLSSYLNPPLDEGYTLLLQYSFEMDCETEGNHPLAIHANLRSTNELLPGNQLDTVVINNSGLRALVPQLKFQSQLLNTTSFDDIARWNFELINIPSMVASSQTDTIPNLWLVANSPTMDITDFELINSITAMPFPLVNGVFQLGDLARSDTIYLELVAKNQSCEEESIELRYGWDCALYQSPINTACFNEFRSLTNLSPPAELEQVVQSPSGPNALCDTLGYHVIDFFNADLGTAYAVSVEGRIPPGLRIVPGSSELAYPSGTTFQTIPDPVLVNSGLVRWDISAAHDSIALNGLVGVNNAPANSAQLRFKAITDCEFIAESNIIFVVEANQNCGLPTNTLAEAGDPIGIAAVSAPYSSSISINPTEMISCQERVDFRIDAFNTATSTLADSFYMLLPPGISYLAGSINPISNAPTSDPNIRNTVAGQELVWSVPEGVLAGNPISFEISLEGFNQLDCTQELLFARIVSPASALCVADGQSCAILVETGSTFAPIRIERPAYSLDDFEIAIQNNGNGFTINFILNGRNLDVESTPPTIFDIYFDTDGDGQWSPADQLLFTDSLTNVIGMDELFSYEGSFQMANTPGCRLIAVIDPAKNCACQTDELTTSAAVVNVLDAPPPLCSGDTISIGVVEQSGHLYQWQPDDHLSCPTCPMTSFSVVNTSNSIQTYTYSLLEEQSDGCIIDNQLEIEVYPALQILNTISENCAGTPIILTATNAVSYQWQGPGITDSSLASQEVSPDTNSLYTVTITDANGCMGTDSLLVEVLPLPNVDAGPDSIYCANEIVQLQATVNDDYTYVWSPAELLSNPAIADPFLLQAVDTVFLLTVTDLNNCMSFDSVRIQFSEAPLLTTPGDQTICRGETINLSVSGATSYEWSPSTGLSCSDCPAPDVQPTETTLYTITASNVANCTTVAQLLVTVQPPIETDELINLCEGDSVLVNGMITTVSGTYCDTLQNIIDCDSIHCTMVELVDTPGVQIEETYQIFLGGAVQIELPKTFNYSWSPSNGLSCTDCFNPVASPTETTFYTVTIENQEGCRSTVRVLVVVEIPNCEEPYVFLPSAFTPNGDGENDVWLVLGNAVDEVEIRVYNRWGQKVFETFDKDIGWDGRFEGKELNTDVFGYYMRVKCIDGQTFFKKGNVTLIR